MFAKYGEKKNRNTARLKFLISKLGMDEFKRRVYGRARGARRPSRSGPSISQTSAQYRRAALRKPAFLQIKKAADR